MNKRRTPQERARIVPEFLNTGTSAAESCHKHNISPATFQNWKDEFVKGEKQALAGLSRRPKAKKPCTPCEYYR